MKTIITICILKFLTGLFNKTKNKNKNFFFKYCLQCFSSEEVLIERKKIV